MKEYIKKVKKSSNLLGSRKSKLSKKPKNLIAEFYIPTRGNSSSRIEVLEV